MPKVSYVSVPPDLKDAYSKQLIPVYKTKNSSLRWGGGIVSPRKVVKVTTRSLLPQISALWKSLDPTTVNLWKSAGISVSYTGYNLFVQEIAYRIKFGIPGEPTPSTLHSFKVGQIAIESPATHFAIVQVHPVRYYRMTKVRGTKSQYEPTPITEILQLPLTVGVSFRTDLTAVSDYPIVKFYARAIRSYQGLDLPSDVGFDIPLSCDWTREEVTLTDVIGHARWYSLYFELSGVVGTLQFDNLLSRHSGTNFARDFRSTNIAAGYTNTNYQVPASWAAVAAVDGASFGSVYPNEGLI